MDTINRNLPSIILQKSTLSWRRKVTKLRRLDFVGKEPRQRENQKRVNLLVWKLKVGKINMIVKQLMAPVSGLLNKLIPDEEEPGLAP